MLWGLKPERRGPDEGAGTAEAHVAARVSTLYIIILAPGRSRQMPAIVVLPQVSHPILEMNTYEHGEREAGGTPLDHHLRLGLPSPGEECVLL